MILQDELIKRFLGIRVWRKGGQRAPHKPLLILYMLGRVQRKEPRMVLYSDVVEALQRLLDDFGPPRRSSPAYPFYHLSNDGIWEFAYIGSSVLIGSPTNRFLLDNNVAGGFTIDVHSALMENPDLVRTIATSLLCENFTDTMHADILQSVGLELGENVIHMNKHRSRNNEFRERILVAYSFKCAVCGFNVWLGRVPVALEAAHIKWYQAGGPDQENNGLLLCVMHHKLFDRGVFSINHNLTIQVSNFAHGGEGFDQWVGNYHGKSIRTPSPPQYRPNDDFIAWHVKEVFRGQGKYTTV